MLYDSVCEAVAKIRRTTESSNPFRVCKEKGILVLPQSLGLEADAIKGFYYTRRRIKTITVNSDLPDVIQRIIVAHELGHACLHAGSGINEFHDIGLFDESSIKEKEDRHLGLPIFRACQGSTSWYHCQLYNSFLQLDTERYLPNQEVQFFHQLHHP